MTNDDVQHRGQMKKDVQVKPDSDHNIDVEYVAKLARLSLSEDEIKLFQRQLRDIVRYVKDIEHVNVDNVEPTAHAVPVQNVFRADECRKGLEREDVLANAPAHDDQQFTRAQDSDVSLTPVNGYGKEADRRLGAYMN